MPAGRSGIPTSLPSMIELQTDPENAMPSRAPNVAQMKMYLKALYGPHTDELRKMASEGLERIKTAPGKKEPLYEKIIHGEDISLSEFSLEEMQGKVQRSGVLGNERVYYQNNMPMFVSDTKIMCCCCPNWPFWQKHACYYCCLCRLYGRGCLRTLRTLLLSFIVAFTVGAAARSAVASTKNSLCGLAPSGHTVRIDCGQSVITNITAAQTGFYRFDRYLNDDDKYAIRDVHCPTVAESQHPRDTPANVKGSPCEKYSPELIDAINDECASKHVCLFDFNETTPSPATALQGNRTRCQATNYYGQRAINFPLSLYIAVQCGKRGCARKGNCDIADRQGTVARGLASESFAERLAYGWFWSSKSRYDNVFYEQLNSETLFYRIMFPVWFLGALLLQGCARSVFWSNKRIRVKKSSYNSYHLSCTQCPGSFAIRAPDDCNWCGVCCGFQYDTIPASDIEAVYLEQNPLQFRCGMGDVRVKLKESSKYVTRVRASEHKCEQSHSCLTHKEGNEYFIVNDVMNADQFMEYVKFHLANDASDNEIGNEDSPVVTKQPRSLSGTRTPI